MKQFLRTYALGLITASLIMGIYVQFFYQEEVEVIVEPITMTESEMIKTLEDSGYFIYETEPTNIDSDLTDDKQDLSVDENVTVDEGEAEDNLATNNESDESNDDSSFTLIIEPGMTITQVSDYLIAANIIDSRNELANYLINNNYGNNIQIGEFELSRNMTIEEVVDIIAKQNE